MSSSSPEYPVPLRGLHSQQDHVHLWRLVLVQVDPHPDVAVGGGGGLRHRGLGGEAGAHGGEEGGGVEEGGAAGRVAGGVGGWN